MLFENFRKSIEDEQERDYSLDDDSQPESRFLGLTPGQRLIAVFLLSIMIIILGVLFLLVTSRIAPPFLG